MEAANSTGMAVRLLQTPAELDRYETWVRSHPEGTLWQSTAYKKYVEASGRSVRLYAAEEEGRVLGSALVCLDTTSFGLSTWEIPRGPVGNHREELLARMRSDAEKERCMAIFLSPPVALTSEILPLRAANRLVHGEATRILDLRPSEEEILSQMKPKGRYNIRIAAKQGVSVRQSEEIDAFCALASETGRRDGFRPVAASQHWAFLKALSESFLLLAYLPASEQPVAGLLGVCWNGRGIYYYGASNYAYRASMAPYALQWEAIRLCKARGCTEYDLLGIAPPKAGNSHPWGGISRFKEHFGGRVITYPPEQQIVLRPGTQKLLALKRRLLG